VEKDTAWASIRGAEGGEGKLLKGVEKTSSKVKLKLERENGDR